MSRLSALREQASDKKRFLTLGDFLDFARRYLDYVADARGIQATIVSQNEPHYQFLQYKQDGHFNVTRPLNSQLFYSRPEFDKAATQFSTALNRRKKSTATPVQRSVINQIIYTAQQAIGATLDALPSGESNKARKINGDLFERFIRLIIQELGIGCTAGTVHVPVVIDGKEQFKMSYQHDLIIKQGELVKAIGSVKTSSKDRLDKIFIDKFLFNRLANKDVPHVAIFLNDVQRKGLHPKYGVSATFLPGHFKGYTVKLNPLDGVYYCDIRPNMRSDPILRDHIRTFDRFVFDDLWTLLAREAVVASIKPKNS
jgi:hypothetical protein